jgi:hypothetical protein
MGRLLYGSLAAGPHRTVGASGRRESRSDRVSVAAFDRFFAPAAIGRVAVRAGRAMRLSDGLSTQRLGAIATALILLL